MALLITPDRPDHGVYAKDPKTGFTQDEMNRHIDAHGKAFRLKTGGLLLVDCLLCRAPVEQINITANCLLRNAIDDPGVDVCGSALLLGPEESDRLSQSVQAALRLDRTQPPPTALVLDQNEAVRPILALGLERQQFRVIQARTATDAVGLCQKRLVDALVLDVSSLAPQALDTLHFLREAQPTAEVLLISAYDRLRVAEWYPGLLNCVQFLQKPFPLELLALLLRRSATSPNMQSEIQVMACAKSASD